MTIRLWLHRIPGETAKLAVKVRGLPAAGMSVLRSAGGRGRTRGAGVIAGEERKGKTGTGAADRTPHSRNTGTRPERIPIALSKPEPGETNEEFAERFARDFMAALQQHRSARDEAAASPATSPDPNAPQP